MRREGPKNFTEWALVGVLTVVLILAVAGMWWAIWCYVMPEIWPTGPENLIRPSFWLFLFAAMLLKGIKGFVRGLIR